MGMRKENGIAARLLSVSRNKHHVDMDGMGSIAGCLHQVLV